MNYFDEFCNAINNGKSIKALVEKHIKSLDLPNIDDIVPIEQGKK